MKKMNAFGLILTTLLCASMSACVASTEPGSEGQEQGASEPGDQGDEAVGEAPQSLTSCASGYGLRSIGWSSTAMSASYNACGGGPTLKYGRHFCLEGVGYHSYYACGAEWWFGYTDGPTYGWVKAAALR